MTIQIFRSSFFITGFLVIALCCLQLKADKDLVLDFESGSNGWSGDFTDYPAGGNEAFFELSWGWETLPAEISDNHKVLTKGMYLSGNNHSDDLFMFIRRPIQGLQPNTEYDLHFVVTIENDIPPDQFGIGGSPGNSVYLKVGASAKKPVKVNIKGNYFLNVDKGNQANGGENAIVVGTLENPLVDPLNPKFEPKIFSNEHSLKVKTDDKGCLWLFVGTDSGFEGITRYYIAKISVSLKVSH